MVQKTDKPPYRDTRTQLKNASFMIDKPPEKIIWFYSEFQPGYVEMTKTIPNIEFYENLSPSFDELLSPERRTFLVINDLMDVAGDDKPVAALFTKTCHHKNASVVYISQNLYHRGKEARTISLNTQYYCLFKNCRDKLQISCLGKQMYPRRTKFFQEAYEDATREKWGYLFVDLRADTPEDLRLRTNIFPGETQIAYIPRV